MALTTHLDTTGDPTNASTSTSTANEHNSTNPFEVVDNNNRDNDDDDDDNQSVQSEASARLRQDFIRLTTTPSVNGNEGEEEDDRYQDAEEEHRNHHHTYTTNYNNNNNSSSGYFALSRNISPSLLAHANSLATASTSPRWLLVGIPLLSIVAHAIFIIGQTAPMWRLSLTAEDISIWANATTSTSKWAFEALNLDTQTHYTLEHNTTVQTFTYGFAVQELWNAKGMPNVFVPKLAAILLVIFSGIWPHLKLLLLQYCWWSTGYNSYQTNNNNSRGSPHRRTRTLGWLALLGKWSLADVLTVCVMVGVLNLEWDIDPPTIKDGIVDHLETLLLLAQQVWSVVDVCNKVLPFDTTDCGSSALNIKEKLKCRGCKTVVKEAYFEPAMVQKTGKAAVKGIDTNGQGTVRLSVVGMDGIYFFCAAVVLSILLSVVVEWYNHKYIEKMMKQRRRSAEAAAVNGGNHSHALSLTSTIATEEGEEVAAAISCNNNNNVSLLSESESDASEPLLDAASREGAGAFVEPMEIMEPDDSASVISNFIQRTANSRTYKCFQCHNIVPMITMAFVAMAIYLPSMKREVGGAIPNLLKDILGIHLDKMYSLQTLRDTCGAAGGMDYLLMATFGLFIVLGPLIRAILVVLVAMTKSSGNSTQRLRSFLVAVANFLAAFCAWEVFLVAIIMVELLMPSVTNTILNTHACQVLSGDGSSCLRVQYERIPTAFACLVLGFLFIGGLAIHVDLEDSKERFMLENTNVGGAMRRHGGAPTVTDLHEDGQYYVEVSNGAADDDGAENDVEDGVIEASRGIHSVTTMIQQEEV